MQVEVRSTSIGDAVIQVTIRPADMLSYREQINDAIAAAIAAEVKKIAEEAVLGVQHAMELARKEPTYRYNKPEETTFGALKTP